jgi:hypothetical protein
MKKFAILLAISLVATAPAFAQATEFGALFGGSKRISGEDEIATGGRDLSEGFTLSNSTVDLYYAVQVDPATYFKVNVGRINTPVGFRERESVGGEIIDVRRDFEGEVQHAEGVIEYRFSEPFGSTGLFVGVGVYRHQAEGQPSATDYGFAGGLTADFPLSRRYGVTFAATYHQTYHEFRPRYLTIAGGLRFAF